MRQRADALVFLLVLLFMAAPTASVVSTQPVAIYKSENWAEKLAKPGTPARQSSILGWNVLAGYATLSPLDLPEPRLGLYAAVLDARSHRFAPGLERWGPRGPPEANALGV